MSSILIKPREIQLYAGEAPEKSYELNFLNTLNSSGTVVDISSYLNKIQALEAEKQRVINDLRRHHQQIINIGEGIETF